MSIQRTVPPIMTDSIMYYANGNIYFQLLIVVQYIIFYEFVLSMFFNGFKYHCNLKF